MTILGTKAHCFVSTLAIKRRPIIIGRCGLRPSLTGISRRGICTGETEGKPDEFKISIPALYIPGWDQHRPQSDSCTSNFCNIALVAFLTFDPSPATVQGHSHFTGGLDQH